MMSDRQIARVVGCGCQCVGVRFMVAIDRSFKPQSSNRGDAAVTSGVAERARHFVHRGPPDLWCPSAEENGEFFSHTESPTEMPPKEGGCKPA
jgi:hypothetical protein